MFAEVARTVVGGGAVALRGRGVRVTHTLLFIAALVVSPGVCGACATRCSERRDPRSGSDSGVASAVAATHGMGSCCGTLPGGPPAGNRSATDSSEFVADAADGLLCCRGGTGCGCLVQPDDDQSAVPPATSPIEFGGPMPAVIAFPANDPGQTGAIRFTVAAVRPPSRPVRVLYGVWRN